MAQQTQVDRVIPKWFEFLERWPTPAHCAQAALGDVLRVWQGLGYPRRARNLHQCAGMISERGGFPRHMDQLLLLPGVGPYTARAILAFAFEDDVAVVDTNVARIVARVHDQTLTATAAQAAADHWLPHGDAWRWNQVLLDIGATLCRPAAARCDDCPLATDCRWRGSGRPDPAIGSAGVSVSQARFVGSDRQARGRLLKRLATGPIARLKLVETMGVDRDRAERLARGLVADGLVVTDPATGELRLP